METTYNPEPEDEGQPHAEDDPTAVEPEEELFGEEDVTDFMPPEEAAADDTVDDQEHDDDLQDPTPA